MFPASGLALAALLRFGRGALPGVWLGSFLLNFSHAWLGGTLTPATACVTALIATGAAAQAWAGGWMVNRWKGSAWRSLEREQDVIGFLLLGGGLASLVSASMAVTGLLALGVIQAPEALFTWWNWYVGDALGVMVFAPLTLCTIEAPGGLWRERRRRIVPPILVTLGLVLLAFFGASRWEKQALDGQLAADGRVIANRIADRLIAHREVLSSLSHFVEATPDFSFRQFEQFTRPVLQENPDIFALSFNDLVRAEERPGYERAVSGLSSPGTYQITERDAQRRLIRAGSRPEYVAVRFIVPLADNQPAVGFDIASEPIRRDAVERSRASGLMAVTAPILLVQERQQRVGLLALLPVQGAPEPGRLGRLPQIGFAVAVVKVDEMIDIATRGHLPTGLVFRLTDARAPVERGLLYRSGARVAGPAPVPRGEAAEWSTGLLMGDRDWTLSVHRTVDYARQHRPWMAWAIGVAGLVFATLLQVLLLGTTGRTAVIERTNEALRASQAQLHLAETSFENSGEAMVVTDAAGCVLSTNPAFSRITGFPPGEVRGKNMRLLKSGRHPAEFYRDVFRTLAAGGRWQGEVWNRRRDGSLFVVWQIITTVRDAAGGITHYVGALSDITEHKQAQEQIEFLAYHDALTRLPNRALGEDRLHQAIARAQRVGTRAAALFLDLDRFKLVNDSFGHGVGDTVLLAVAQRLQGCLREADSLCRLSGDEFLVVLYEVSDQKAVAAVCEKILRQVVEPFDLPNGQLTISLSIGVAVYPEDGRDAGTLLRNADRALYAGKKSGGGTYRFFDSQMNTDVVLYLQLHNDLRLALERQEFELFYQPQVEVRTGRVTGVEALIRWRHPRLGLQLPGDFIPTAEESGLIVPIGAWVLREACRQGAEWGAAGIPFGVLAVNLSAVQLQHGAIEETVADALRETGLEPGRLELELTESVLVEEPERALATLQRLKVRGIRLSIDDFGTGYSSLAYLKRLDVDKLKIDRSFVVGIVDDPEDRAIVHAVVQMARSLGLKTIAEGVERADELALLLDLECDEVQGYLFSRPLPVAEITAYLKNAASEPAAHDGG